MIKAPQKIAETELVELVKSNSQSAFSYLYDHYSGALYGVIFRIVNDSERSNDVLQDVFVKIWKNKDSYDASKGTFFTWMLNIARNSAIDSNRSKHVKHKIQIEDHIVDKEKRVEETHQIDWIGMKETIEKLRPDFQQLISYIYLQGYTQQEYSDEFEIPLGTVKTRTRTALQELRALLNIGERE